MSTSSSDDERSPAVNSTAAATDTAADTALGDAYASTVGTGGGRSVQSAFAFPSVFGEASMSGDTSQLTDGVGTGPYIAPEQGARFGQYNHKADMWSLGVILFEVRAFEKGGGAAGDVECSWVEPELALRLG